MCDENRSNKDEFLSFLSTCMTFYNMHLTPYEQAHITYDMVEIFAQHMTPKDFIRMCDQMKVRHDRWMMKMYADTDSVNAVMGGGETNGNDQI